MITMKVPDMSCSHCGGVITKAVKGIDPAAEVQLDYAAKTVTVRTEAAAAEVSRAVDDAGYPNTVS